MTLSVGDKAPDFSLPESLGKARLLSDLYRQKTVVLYFYPKDDTVGCTVEACTFRDLYDAFARAGAEVLGVSADSIESHGRFADKHRLPMKLVSDSDKRISALYDVRPTLGILPGRATFVIDRAGVIRHVFVSQLRFGRHAHEALDVVKRLEAQRSA